MTNIRNLIGALFEFFLMFLILVPPLLEYIPNSETIFEVINYLKLLLILFIVFKSYKSFNRFEIVLLLLALWCFASTLLNGGNIRYYAQFLLSSFVTVLWSRLYLTNEQGLKRFLYYLLIVNVLNILTIYFFPDGLALDLSEGRVLQIPVWLLGTSNEAVPVLLLSSIVGFLCIIKYRSFLGFLLMGCNICEMYSGTAVTGMVGLTVFLLSIFLMLISPSNRRIYFSSRILLLTVFFAFFVLVIGLEIPALQYLVENVLGKDMTFTGRTPIWKKALELIAQNPIMGIGIKDMDDLIQLIGHSHCHDYYLNLTMETGLVGLALWIAAIVKSYNSLDKYRKERIAYVLSMGLFAFLITLLTESYNNRYLSPFFITIALSYNIGKILKKDIQWKKQ